MSEDPTRRPPVRRVAMVSLHTSPLLRPGTGDAGGLNVYVVETAAELARRGVEVDIFTRATGAGQARSVDLEPGLPVSVHHVPAGPLEGVPKDQLPGHVCAFADDLSRHVAGLAEGHYDVIHAHYWLSGQAGGLTSRRFDVPLVQTMHTMARVKNRSLAAGETPEPQARVEGEQELVDRADALVANTPAEARDLVELYAAAPDKVHVVPPGVALDTFAPGDREEARRATGLDPDAEVLLFVGRIQPLKGPDVLVRAAGELVRRDPARRERLVVAVLGGLSGSGLTRPGSLGQVAREEGVADLVHLVPPVSREELATWMRAADVVAIPSHHESFGLVAVEALACGTPVVAARVGGLPLAVGDVGVLVDGHDPGEWADALAEVLDAREDGSGLAFAARAREHAQAYSWERTVDALLDAYAAAVTTRRGGHHG
ncbi:Glycosyltransferase MshA involved in mycothiol biosynthesis [Serinicoccus hydrothermalis]|uniref:D-inositol-3-phosphate glycosyltransferase n=1 Tax=Serinicoccus hydrothermalis TaxID=1758689 RepID=A0A1B1NF27_9MICO|nr:D-inositol-3-phosphate glycosyltransferase [Serinicoccus hydrothermalis]ANS79999.1 Glycosyltransferase MshA involved in mycothiol biosynthesis [Serinicoccus hydrothermalis]